MEANGIKVFTEKEAHLILLIRYCPEWYYYLQTRRTTINKLTSCPVTVQ